MGHSEKESIMKSSEVKAGEIYHAKVSGNLTAVRIVREADNGKGWHAVNIKTKRPIRIKSAQRLRRPLTAKEAGIENTAPKSPVRKPRGHRKADVAKTVEAVAKGDLTKGVTVPTSKKKAGKKAAAKADGEKRPSGLDAAAQVLAEAKEPLNTKEMVARMLAKGLWRTSGKTPAATIYAAIIREINAKGDDARFRTVARGKFDLSK